MSAIDRSVWHEWVAERPPHVRAVAERFFPWYLYLLKTTGQHVCLVSFSEHDGSCMPPQRGPRTGEPCKFCSTTPRGVSVTVAVLAKFNPGTVFFDREVFGIRPEDLVEISESELVVGEDGELEAGYAGPNDEMDENENKK